MGYVKKQDIEEKISSCCVLLKEGLSTGQIAKKLKISRSGLCHLLKRHGVEYKFVNSLPRRMRNPADIVTLSYAAGIIDGEGCISLHRANDSEYKAKCSYALHVAVSMTDMVVPAWLYLNFGGSLCHYKGRTPNRKDTHMWTVAAENARRFLIDVLPYLKLKKPQAEIAVEFQTIKHSNRGRWNSRNSKPFILIEAESILASKIHALNGGEPWQASF